MQIWTTNIINRWLRNSNSSNSIMPNIDHQRSKCKEMEIRIQVKLLQYNKIHFLCSNNHAAKRQPIADPHAQKSSAQIQSQHLPKSTSQYHHRPERPKTLDTQPTILHGHKAIIFNAAQSPSNNIQKPAVKTPASEDEQRRPEPIRTDKAVRLSVPNSAILAQKLSSGSSAGSTVPFDEQEEWKKISEIMANFGTDTDILNDSTSNRRRDYRSCENGRSNSVAGFTFSELDRHRNAMKSNETSANVQRRSGTQSPHGQLMNFLYDNHLDELSQILYDNGYDDVDFIKGILDESDFDAMDIKPELRKKLMAAIESDLQKPARAITAVNKTATATDSNKSSAYHSMNTNHHEKLQHANSIATDSNYNNNIYSTMPKQKHDDDATAALSVNDWLEGIRLSQYADVFRYAMKTPIRLYSFHFWCVKFISYLYFSLSIPRNHSLKKTFVHGHGADKPDLGDRIASCARDK